MRPALPLSVGGPSAVAPQPRDWDVLLTAETHNFPCAVAPYPGAALACSGLVPLHSEDNFLQIVLYYVRCCGAVRDAHFTLTLAVLPYAGELSVKLWLWRGKHLFLWRLR